MNKFVKIAMVASMATMPFAANAAPADGTYSGPVQVHKGLTLDCTLTVDVINNGTQVDNLDLAGPLCGLVSFNGAPYNVAYVSGDTYEIQGVSVSTITPGNCEGSITADYEDATPPAIHLAGSLPTAGLGGDCTIDGTLEKE